MTLEGPEKEANLENIEQKERQCQDGDEKAGVWLLTGSEKRRKTGSAKRKGEMKRSMGLFSRGNGTSTKTSPGAPWKDK